MSNNRHVLARGLDAQHTSNSDRPALRSSFVTHKIGTDTLLQSAEEQKSSFRNVWDGIHDRQQRALRSMLSNLAAEEGNQRGIAYWLPIIGNCLRAQDNHGNHDGHENDEYATKVATFVSVLGGLAALGIREMHAMTQSPTTEIVLDNESVGPDTSSYYTAFLSVINSCDTTAECTDSADDAGDADSTNGAHGLVVLMGFGVLLALTMLMVLPGPKRHGA